STRSRGTRGSVPAPRTSGRSPRRVRAGAHPDASRTRAQIYREAFARVEGESMKYICLVYLEEQKLRAVSDTECKSCGEGFRKNGVLLAAGISTASGIPDFRGPQGVWTRDPEAEKLSNIHYYMSDPAVRRRAWKGRRDHPAWQAVPNAGHRALVDLERRGTLHALITQNIDGLHQVAGNSPDT